ncbi:Siderophore synthetase component [Alteribacillus persepolensis]|uniref:Siderophore synthetase component n=1 Tax=Alteribacillus persepolensis TaxID=568899 RepID=A0A1G8FPB1_9BACI|nr:IucA/IucC family protein [Alteribacillus persepolensis]SDH83766.1 Siderophore synthetase component [Alteribacillus persepolensis]
MNNRETAQQKAMECFLNCYVRETSSGLVKSGTLHIPLPRQGAEIKAPLKYYSITERHLYSFPILYRLNQDAKWHKADVVILASLLAKELSLDSQNAEHAAVQELMKRVLLSVENMELFLDERQGERSSLYCPKRHFLDSEQSLLFGHLLHPTPKSRQGMDEKNTCLYSPETKGKFPLHYFLVHESLAEVEGDEAVSAAWALLSNQEREAIRHMEEFYLFPLHPLQAKHLLEDNGVRKLIKEELFIDLGMMGEEVSATSSIRTVYNEKADYMWKLSIPVKVTNSLRVNKKKELTRGRVVNDILDSEIGTQLKTFFPEFYVIRDPAYLALKGEKESGFEVVIRENPFQSDSEETTLIAGLCQDALPEESNHLQRIIERIAAKENRKTEQVSVDWFQQYLDISIKPLLWLYFIHGIGLEAHQQNAVLKMREGYPCMFYYRDNQGYYFAESKLDYLQRMVPDIKDKSDTVCTDELIDERLRYYIFFNHLFGLINAFGASGLVQEEVLLYQLRQELMNMLPLADQSQSELVQTLLHQKTLPSKANLLTRVHNMDELVGSLASQSVYTAVHNPLVSREVQSVGTNETSIRA